MKKWTSVKTEVHFLIEIIPKGYHILPVGQTSLCDSKTSHFHMEMHHFPVRENRTLFAGLEGVLQADGAVEDQVAGGAVAAGGAAVAQTHELVAGRSLGVGQ